LHLKSLYQFNVWGGTIKKPDAYYAEIVSQPPPREKIEAPLFLGEELSLGKTYSFSLKKMKDEMCEKDGEKKMVGTNEEPERDFRCRGVCNRSYSPFAVKLLDGSLVLITRKLCQGGERMFHLGNRLGVGDA